MLDEGAARAGSPRPKQGRAEGSLHRLGKRDRSLVTGRARARFRYAVAEPGARPRQIQVGTMSPA